MRRLLAAFAVGFVLALWTTFSAWAQTSPQLTILNQAGDEITTLTDGALVRLSIEVADAVQEPTTFSFYLDRRANLIADCRIPSGARSCTTDPVGTLGWYWEENKVMPKRALSAANAGLARWLPVATRDIALIPRPVVLVHGFGSDYHTWANYLGPSGYLALMGLRGFAVGDGQVEGTLYTGNLLDPNARTNTIAGNAQVLAEYIANVKTLTGADAVDLVVHSMGGLISRYYIDRVMQGRDVAQLIMLGTPNGGSNCSLMLGNLGIYQPAALELREDYVRNVFNPQIHEQRSIPFYNFAGTPIQNKLLSPCSQVPSDMVVSLRSASDAPVELTQVPFLHTDLTTSAELFTDDVAPLLRKSRENFETQGAQRLPRINADAELVQYSQVYTGVVTTAQDNTHIINIDSNVAVASFGLYDPSRTLTVTVRGASGNVIVLTPDRNGLTIVSDPESLIYLGYGFNNPNPGPWQVTVHATPRTPPLGTEYAIVAQYEGGASIASGLSSHLPGINQQIELTATMTLGGDAIASESATVILTRPDGTLTTIATATDGDGITATIQPDQIGIYALDISLHAVLPDGTVAERTSYLAFEAFEEAPAIRQP
jgi:pimeloyl-ACP methyl ester carboxylesterase